MFEISNFKLHILVITILNQFFHHVYTREQVTPSTDWNSQIC